MIVAAVMSLLSYKLKQPMVIGYIIAGMIIGPFTLIGMSQVSTSVIPINFR